MPLELINTAAGLLTVTIVAAAALAALIQLRHLRAANQINALLAVGEKLDSRDFTDAITLLNSNLEVVLADPEYRRYELAIRRRVPPPIVESRFAEMHHACVLVGNTFELMGLLVKNGIVDQTLFVDQYCGVTLGAWKRLAAFTAFGREAGDPNGWEYFEYLAVLSEDWLSSHQESYPKGIRRYPLRNPWPLQ
ncbi:MAG TPA: hypothetical protein VHT92_10260 [Candidatus Cybelea sp.]|jgi:hypothetical protein|nr:hypothetical protein [Candidatus Cybelea sp.]